MVFGPNRNCLQPNKNPDPMINMNDMITSFQIPEIREEGSGVICATFSHPSLLPEDIRFGEDLHPGVR